MKLEFVEKDPMHAHLKKSLIGFGIQDKDFG